MTHRLLLRLSLLAAFLLSISPPLAAEPRFALSRLGEYRPNRDQPDRWPYFDHGRLRHTPDKLPAQVEQSCRALFPDCPETDGYRVESAIRQVPTPASVQIHCQCLTGKPERSYALLLTDHQARPLWHRIDGQKENWSALGAGPNGLILDTGEILEPETGRLSRRFRAKDYTLGVQSLDTAWRAALHPRLGVFMFHASDKKKEAGIFLQPPGEVVSQRWFPRRFRWLGIYQEYPHSLAVSHDGRWLFAGTMWSTRGPHYSELTIYDLEKRRIAHQEQLDDISNLTIDAITTGPDGQLALHRNIAGRPYGYLHLRWAPEAE